MEKRATRERILESARALLEASDVPDLRVRDVCAHANVSMGSLTHHFANKRALLDACLAEYERRHEALVQAEARCLRDADLRVQDARVDAIAAMTRRLYRFYRAERAALRLHFAMQREQVQVEQASSKGVDPQESATEEGGGDLATTDHGTDARLANALASGGGLSLLQARLAVRSLNHLCVTYALFGADELEQMAAELASTPLEEAQISDHIAQFAARLVCN